MIQEKITIGDNTKYPLKGILTLPDHITNPVPAVIFVHGSGSSNMDEKVGKLTPFKDLAEGLVKYNIASIRYDKRTYSHALKMFRDKKVTITVKEETIEDALLATDLLRLDTRIDSNNIFIIGHSMGGMLAPRIDDEGGHYKGLIIMAGSPRKLEDIMIEQTNEVLENLNPVMKFLLKGQLNKINKSFEGLYDLSDEEAKKKKIGSGTTAYYFKEMGEHPTSKYLANINKPMLIIQGEKDFQVKLDKDFNAYKELLKDKSNITFKLYDNLNHCFVPSIYGDITKAKQEYNIEQHISNEIIKDIAQWINKTASKN